MRVRCWPLDLSDPHAELVEVGGSIRSSFDRLGMRVRCFIYEYKQLHAEEARSAVSKHPALAYRLLGAAAAIGVDEGCGFGGIELAQTQQVVPGDDHDASADARHR